jgi:hypothetical protein
MLPHILATTLTISNLVAIAAPIDRLAFDSSVPLPTATSAQSSREFIPSHHFVESPVSYPMHEQVLSPMDIEVGLSSIPASSPETKELNLLSVLERREKRQRQVSVYNKMYYERRKLGVSGNMRRGKPAAKLDPKDPKYEEKRKKQESDRIRNEKRRSDKKKTMRGVVQNEMPDGLGTGSSSALDTPTTSTGQSTTMSSITKNRRPPRSTLPLHQLLKIRKEARERSRRNRMRQKMDVLGLAPPSA